MVVKEDVIRELDKRYVAKPTETEELRKEVEELKKKLAEALGETKGEGDEAKETKEGEDDLFNF